MSRWTGNRSTVSDACPVQHSLGTGDLLIWWTYLVCVYYVYGLSKPYLLLYTYLVYNHLLHTGTQDAELKILHIVYGQASKQTRKLQVPQRALGFIIGESETAEKLPEAWPEYGTLACMTNEVLTSQSYSHMSSFYWVQLGLPTEHDAIKASIVQTRIFSLHWNQIIGPSTTLLFFYL